MIISPLFFIFEGHIVTIIIFTFTAMSANDSRLYTLIYKTRSFFRLKDNEIVGISVSKEDVQRAVSPDNIIIGQGVKKIVVSDTAPVSPEPGDIWIDIS